MLTTTPFTDLSAQMAGRVVTARIPTGTPCGRSSTWRRDLRPAASRSRATRATSSPPSTTRARTGCGSRRRPPATTPARTASLDDALLVDVRELQDVSHRPRRPRVRVGAGVKWERVAPQLSELGPGRPARLVARRRHRRLLARRRHGLAGAQVRPADQQRHGDRAGHGGRAPAPASTPSTSPTCSGRCAAATATSAWSRRSSSRSTRSRSCTRARCSSRSSARPRCCTPGRELLPTLPDELMTWASLLQFPDAARSCPRPCAAARSPSSRRVPRRRGRRPRAAAPGARPRARPWTRSRWCRPSASATWRWTRPTRCRSRAPRPARRPAARGGRRPRRRGGPGLRARRWRWCSCATWAARWRARRRAPARGRRCPATFSLFALGVRRGRARRRRGRRGATSTSVERAVAPYRAGDYPNFVEEPADASGFFDADTWARLRQVKALYDPERPVQGQPPHPARRVS